MDQSVSKSIPLDLEAALASDAWQESFRWPMEHGLARDFHLDLAGPFNKLLTSQGDPFQRDALVLAAPLLWMRGLSNLEHALLVQALRSQGALPLGGPPIVHYLDGRKPPADHTFGGSVPRPPVAIRYSAVRRIVRTASWTDWWRLPSALFSPNAIAISHNSLLVGEAHRRRAAVSFMHAPIMLESLGKPEKLPGHEPLARELADQVAQCFATHPGLREPYRTRLLEYCRMTMIETTRDALAVMHRLRGARQLPSKIWAATGGYWPARAIRLEVRRRGGSVTGFDHGGTTAMVEEGHALNLIEMSVSDHFVLPTEAMAGRLEKSAEKLAAPFGFTSILHGRGDPKFGVPVGKTRAASERMRVVYLSAPFLGPRQQGRPTHHDVVRLHWNMSLVRVLQTMPVELLCQPHPEGILAGRTHPLSRIAETSRRKFEDVADWADVIVTDMINSTTTWVAACGDKPLVLVDLDMSNLNRALKFEFDERFRIVKASYDERNLPTVDGDELEQAILSGPVRADPSAFRELLAGETA